MISITQESLELTRKISFTINEQTFHHHYHILYDLAREYDGQITYVEIGCYAGGSACLMLQRPHTKVISIDLGYPINQEQVLNNVAKTNVLHNSYEYIQGDSHLNETKNRLNNIPIDILFIDGDHTYKGVKMDFEMYQELVKPGGFIVFDDYHDEISSPEVKVFVDDLVNNLNGYEIIGTFKNIGAKSTKLVNGNCFVIRKLKK
jgi:predicted O-methyltransferase YrrM